MRAPNGEKSLRIPAIRFVSDENETRMTVFTGRYNPRSTTKGQFRANEEEKDGREDSTESLSAGWFGERMKVDRRQKKGLAWEKTRRSERVK
jgi:hypothetical protein